MNRGRYARDTMGNRRCIFPMLSKMTNLLQKARKKTLSNHDLEEYSLGKDYARKDASRLETLWKQACFQQVEGASFLHACFLFIRRQFIFSCILSTFAEIVGRIGGVMVICETLKYVEKQDWDVYKGLMLTFLLVAVVVIRVFVLNNVLYANSKVAVRLRTAILILFYKHISKMKSTVVSVGEVVNILTNDGARIYDAVLNCHVICRTMLVLLAVLTFIIHLIGVTALGGVLALLTVIISQSIAAKILTKQRSKYSKISAERVKIMNEILTYAKLIKMYVWEKSFAAKIKEIRKRELNQLEKVNFLHGLTLTFVYAANPSAMVTIMLTIVFTGREISVPELFGLLVCFTTLANIVHSLPIVLKPTVEALVAIKRIQKILQIQDHPFTYEVPQKSENAVEVSNASFSWRMSELDGSNVNGYGHIDDVAGSVVSPDMNEESMLNSRNQLSDKLVLCDMNIEIPKSSLVGICGAIGSGKTSFLNALLGQLPMVSGRVAVAGRFSYVPQQAWIMNATVRKNIIFNEDFDPVRYAEIIEACSLTEDLAVLEQGDNTEIGERGINLSGGQKQRVNLARALYSGGDIFLLDDPLSAVDAHVGKHIFHRCIRELMKDKTVIFVTHHLQYLQYCDDIYLLRSGRIYENGSHNVLMEKDTEYRTLIKTHYNKNLKTPTKEEEHSINHDTLTKQPDEQKYDDTIKSNNMDIPAESGKLIRKEDAGIGAGKFSYLWKYIKYTGGVPTLIVFIFLSIFASSTTLAVNLTLTLWIDAGAGSFNTSGTDYHSNDIRLNPDFPKYVTAYALVFVAIFVFGTASTFFNIKIFRKASGRIHNKMFNKLILAKMQFFDTTPIGRILNRFSKDMDDIDNNLPTNLEFFVCFAFSTLGFLLAIAFIWPSIVCVLVFLVATYVYYTRFFSPGFFNVKRLENTTSSLAISHITATVRGSATIQAYNKTEHFQNTFETLLTNNSTALHLNEAVLLWVWIRLDVLTIIGLLASTLYGVFNQGTLSSPVTGLLITLSYIVTTGLAILVLKNYLQISLRLISVERVEEYIRDVEPEETMNIYNNKDDWVVDGKVQFNNYSMRYRKNLPTILNDITIKINAGEKVGIVGRTGSGKSSLGVAMYRLAERVEGTITIDDVEIHNIKLNKLRQKLSIIPQDPVLFAGTVRYNLDPFNEFSDEDIWKALERTHVKDLIFTLGEQLEAPVVENGENFSVGERQLICMARALLRKNKILILDEATAAIDTETDSMIQQTIRESFSNCTLLIIAHRLNTILDCDTILVMDGGRVAEMDRPEVLLADEDSVLNKMKKTYFSTK